MIVVDSSVWIDSLRSRASPSAAKLKALIATDAILIGDLILLDVLQGSESDRHAAFLQRYFGQFKLVEMLGADIAVKAAANFRSLRGRGITVRRTTDMIIGTFCIENGHLLLQQDRDFLPMAEHLGLRLA